MTVYYKTRQILLQNATSILLQKATKVYYKMRQVFYYKMRQFYYKMQHLLQIATVHSFTYSFKFTFKCFVRLAFHNSYERY